MGQPLQSEESLDSVDTFALTDIRVLTEIFDKPNLGKEAKSLLKS
jgi:hypothetical protein